MKPRYQSDLLRSIHENAVGLRKIGAIDDKEMAEYDEDCLVMDVEPAYVAEGPIMESAVRPVFSPGP